MTQPLPSFGASVSDRPQFAAAIGLSDADLASGLPVQVVSCGVPFLFAPIATRRAVDAVVIDRKALARACATAGIEELPLFVFTSDGDGAAGAPNTTVSKTVYSRMLAPAFGIGEDPATGGASGPLGCYMLQHGVVDAAAAQSIVSLQGVAMKRPSRIHIAIDSRDGAITRVRVGGRAVLVGHGELRMEP
jgi:trans-2,3-dihydro-3-hydroxyanthranilate isomerase